MSIANSSIPVPQPAVGATRYGLLRVANGPLEMPRHADVSGIVYEEEHCGTGFLWPAAQCATVPDSKTWLPSCAGLSVGAPFITAAGYQLGPVGRDADDFERRTLVRLHDNEQLLVERAFWGGQTVPTAVPDVLATSGMTLTDVTPTPGTPVPIEQAVGLLEEFLGDYSYQGILHARPIVAPYATERRLALPTALGDARSRLVDPLGNNWSFGRGYSGNKPGTTTAPTAGNAYIMATGAVTLWRGEEHINPPLRSMNRTTNQVYTLAERPWIAAIDCLVGYVLTSLAGM